MLWGPPGKCGIQHRHIQSYRALKHPYCYSSGSTAVGTGDEGEASEQSMYGIRGGGVLHICISTTNVSSIATVVVGKLPW